ncbi:MAG: YCF48-related protein [Planctomycetota bacterium]|nr:YCF48-related protein [Planctomycetota bacterium]
MRQTIERIVLRSTSLSGRLILGVVILAAASASHAAEQQIEMSESDAELRGDATICDITFLDSHVGWAVGERGAIWHTSDGGMQWNTQEAPVECTLHSVSFVDDRIGWAAGGWTEPYTHISRGEILRTVDGGKHWTIWSKDPLPRIKKIQFFNRKDGIALVAASPLYPHGLLVTTDGGQSWSAPPSDHPTRWECGDFESLTAGHLVGKNGFGAMRTDRVDKQDIEMSNPASNNWIGIRRADAQVGYALACSGDLYFTHQNGRRWEFRSKVALPDGFSPEALEAHGRHLWICGSPGNLILYSGDGGMHWETQSTGQSLPLRAVHFASPEQGWAAGAMGTILHTQNGGASWQIQQQRRKRAALLGVFATARAVPLEIFSQLSAGEGYSSSVMLLGHTPLTPSVPLDDASTREREALLHSGVNIVDQGFRVPISPAWINANSPEPISGRPVTAGLCQPPYSKENLILAFESHIERQIRLVRPDVVVTHPATHRRRDPLGFQINQAVLRAVDRAATETATEASTTRLPPWQVRKVLAYLPPRHSGGISISTRRWMLPLASTLSDYTQRSHALLEVFPRRVESVSHFSVILNKLPQGRGGSDFFSGLYLTPGGGSRRLLAADRSVPIDALRQRAGRADILKSVLASAGAGQPSSAAWRAQIHRAAAELPIDQAAQLLVHIAAENFTRGNAPLAAETLGMLIDHAPEHPLASAAWKWLATYKMSGEFQYQDDNQAADAAGDVQLVNALPISEQNDVAPSAWGERLQRARPVLFRDPRIQLPLAAAFRQEGKLHEAERVAMLLAQANWLGKYTGCSHSEDNLSTAKSAAAAPTWTAMRVRSKPYLDGKLDDPCWATEGNGIALLDRTGTTDAPTQVQVCFDPQFLYFAIRCRKAEGVAYASPPPARGRDANLNNHDRVQILLDIDRDYATCYRLTVDSRGCTHDQLWMDATWDPEWYVAQAANETHWTCELAIPLAALSDQKGTTKRQWACGVQRILPDRGFQSWTIPASLEIEPAGFGHLQLPASMD